MGHLIATEWNACIDVTRVQTSEQVNNGATVFTIPRELGRVRKEVKLARVHVPSSSRAWPRGTITSPLVTHPSMNYY